MVQSWLGSALGGAKHAFTEVAAFVGEAAGKPGADAAAAASEIGHLASDAYGGVRDAVSSVRSFVSDARAVATSLLGALEDSGDRQKTIDRFVAALPIAAPLSDAKADAIALSAIGEAGAGVYGTTGVEIRYVRAQGERPAQLQVGSVSGGSFRLQAGASTRAYLSNFYGDAQAIAESTRIVGGEINVLVAGIGTFRAPLPEGSTLKTPVGWSTSLSAGLGIGVPILGDSGGFNYTAAMKATFELTPDETARIEAALKVAPDRSLLRSTAEALM